MSSSIYRDCKAVHASFKIRNSIGYSKIEADEIAGIAAADWLKLEDISEEACSELEKH